MRSASRVRVCLCSSVSESFLPAQCLLSRLSRHREKRLRRAIVVRYYKASHRNSDFLCWPNHDPKATPGVSTKGPFVKAALPSTQSVQRLGRRLWQSSRVSAPLASGGITLHGDDFLLCPARGAFRCRQRHHARAWPLEGRHGSAALSFFLVLFIHADACGVGSRPIWRQALLRAGIRVLVAGVRSHGFGQELANTQCPAHAFGNRTVGGLSGQCAGGGQLVPRQ